MRITVLQFDPIQGQNKPIFANCFELVCAHPDVNYFKFALVSSGFNINCLFWRRFSKCVQIQVNITVTEI